MGLLGDVVGGVVGGAVGFCVGGPAGAVAGAVGGVAVAESVDGSDPSSAPPPQNAPAPDYSDAMLVMSNNSKDTALAQIESQEFAMSQAAATQDMQHAATLELSLETFDTKLQTSKMGFMQNMKAEQDRHIEKMAANAAQFRQITSSFTDTSADIPAPTDD